MFVSPKSRRLAVAAAALIALSACGRAGDLEPPPGANAVQASGKDQPLAGRKAIKPITPPKQDFVLDPLLK